MAVCESRVPMSMQSVLSDNSDGTTFEDGQDIFYFFIT